MIGSVEQSRLIQFIRSGGGLYLEGNDLYKDHRNTALSDYLPGTFGGDGRGAWLGNISRVEGPEGTVVQGFVFKFPQWGHADEAPDEIIQGENDTVLLTCQKGHVRVLATGPMNQYNVVASSVMFGVLRQGEKHRSLDTLMQRYLKFLF